MCSRRGRGRGVLSSSIWNHASLVKTGTRTGGRVKFTRYNYSYSYSWSICIGRCILGNSLIWLNDELLYTEWFKNFYIIDNVHTKYNCIVKTLGYNIHFLVEKRTTRNQIKFPLETLFRYHPRVVPRSCLNGEAISRYQVADFWVPGWHTFEYQGGTFWVQGRFLDTTLSRLSVHGALYYQNVLACNWSVLGL